MNNDDFYQKIPAFSDFTQLLSSENFFPVPESWYVIIADVKGSTKAIQQGRYKQVNMIGASSIACVVNCLGDFDFPYVFGGDGATLLIPETYLQKVIKELQQLQSLAKQEFQLELRVGYVQLKALYELGCELSIGKYQLSEGNYLAQFKGSALTKAEFFIKKEQAGAAILMPGLERSPTLTGLSCRLNPLQSKNGTMLSILVQPQNINSAESDAVLKEALGGLLAIISDDFSLVSPVRQKNLKWSWMPKSLFQELKLNGISFFSAMKVMGKMLQISVANLSLIFNIPLGPFKPLKYKKELVINSDFKKFDETLRLVLDCSLAQADNIEKFLEELYVKNRVFYGSFRSKDALMTCMVQSASNNRHIHFIDGADGGYALAAIGLKSQMSEKSAG